MNGYGYVEDIPHLNKEEVLCRVTQQEIFSIVMECRLGEYVTSPFRQDDSPGAYFDWYGSKLLFIDFADPIKRHRDCFNAIQEIYGVSFLGALNIIDDHFNLGLKSGRVALPARVELPSRAPKILKDRTDIVYSRRYFNRADKIFWEPFEITSTQLVQDKVLGIRWYKFFSKRANREIVIRPQTVCYAYIVNDNVKIYTPHAINRDIKWITNCTADDIGFIDELPFSGQKLVITKSYKDCRILRNMGIQAIWFQNEGMLPNDQILNTLCQRFGRIFVLFDSDNSGKIAADKVVGKLNSMYPNKATSVFFPSGGKDTGEFFVNQGKPMLLRFLNYMDMM